MRVIAASHAAARTQQHRDIPKNCMQEEKEQQREVTPQSIILTCMRDKAEKKCCVNTVQCQNVTCLDVKNDVFNHVAFLCMLYSPR